MRFLHKCVCFALCVIAVCGCRQEQDAPLFHDGEIHTFRDIPGVTEKEIKAIETLQREHGSFTYGMILSTEAFRTEDGSIGGYTALLCDWLSELFGIKFVPEIFTSDELLSRLNAGEIDFSGNMMPTEERLKKYYMTDTIAERKFVTVRIPGSRSFYEIQKERPLKFAFAPNSPIEASVASVMDKGTYVPLWVNNFSNAYSLLLNGDADAYIITNIVNESFIDHGDVVVEDFFPLIFNPVSMAAADAALEPVISVVNKALRNGSMTYLSQLYNQGQQEYLKHKMSVLLTEEERAYIRNNPVAPIAGFNNNYPLCFFNNRYGEWQGIYFDLLDEISSLTGLSFKLAHDETANWLVINELLLSGKAAMIPELVRTREREALFLWSDTLIMNDYYALISKTDFRNISLNEILYVKVGLAQGTAHAAMFKRWFPSHQNIVEYGGIDQAFNALLEGEVDMVMSTQRRLMQLTHYQEQPGYKTNIIFHQPLETKFGFNKDYVILCSIIDKAFKLVDIEGITSVWTQRTYDYSKKMAEDRTFISNIFLVILVIFLAALVILLVRNIKLRMLSRKQMIILSAIYKSTPDMLVSKDINGAFTSCNPSFEEFAGCSEKELIGKTIDEIPGLADRMTYNFSETDKIVLQKGITVSLNEWFMFNDGSRKFIETYKIPLIQGERVIGLLGTMHDITQHKMAMEATQKEHERTRIMLDTIPLACFIVSGQVKVSDCNSECVRLFGLKNRQDFINRFEKELSPEYQPDGRLSHDAIISYGEKAFRDGKCVFEWMHQLPDGNPIPAIVTVEHVTYGEEDALMAYIRDMREHTQMTHKINKQNDLLEAVNRVSSVLLEPDMENFEDSLLRSMEIMANAVNVDRVCIWKNHETNGRLYCSLAYDWTGNNMTCVNKKYSVNISYDDVLHGWEETLSQGKCINCRVSDLSADEQEQLKNHSVMSLIVSPVFVHDAFWGYVGYDDLKNERVFTESEEIILRSAGRMFANAFIRNDMTRSIIDTTVQLETAVAEANEANRLKNISVNSMERILNSIDAMIYVTDPDTNKILFMNDCMKLHYGIEGDCIGQLCYERLQVNYDTRCSFCPCFQLDTEPDKTIVWEEHSQLTNRIYHNTDRYIEWPNGKTVHIQYSLDMTELISAKEQAEESSRSKSIFLSHMSHEIRTPMNAILGIAEIQLQEEKHSKATKDAFGKIYESGDLLLNIINDILDLSKIESGKLELVPVQYDIPSLVNDTAQLNRMRYDSKPIEFSIHIDVNTPFYLIGDELRIKQVLNNILSNAFKYTDEGKVGFSISTEDEPFGDNDVTLILRVSDTGQGMTESQLGRLFDEYSRFNLNTNRTTVGTGLGMNITKRLLNLMYGEIAVESTPGVGSVFTVRLPQKRVNSEVCGKEVAEKLQNFDFQSTTITRKIQFLREYMPYGKVLVVDDVESNIYVTKGMLIPYGIKVDTASNGFEAINKIKEGNEYDIIFMDHMMPKMDGIEAVKIIRGMGYTNTIIALTANALIGRAKMFMEKGFDGFISKPIDSRELNQALNDFIRNKKPPEVVEMARQEMRSNPAVVPHVSESSEKNVFFVRDAENAVKTLESLSDKLNSLNGDDLVAYITAVHGIKNVLLNIGYKELSEKAYELEQAGEGQNYDVMFCETPSFINALKTLSAKYKIVNKNKIFEISAEDKEYLREKLLVIKDASTAFDKNTAKNGLDDLRKKEWPDLLNAVFDDIATYLLHSEFKKAAAAAKETAEQYK